MRNFWCLVCLLCFLSVAVKARSSEIVDALLSIASDLGYSQAVAETWKGTDPCHPHWYGVFCIGGRIDAIDLIGENLTGVISPRFAEITSLRVLDLSQNRLTGTIPSKLTRLNLTVLDLSDNQLHGKVPPFKNTVVEFGGNPGIETDGIDVVPWQRGSKTPGTVRGLSIGIIVLSVLLIVGGCLVLYREMR
ncbi:unnamed protein product [Microthlaspi erraticum]|uniref:Leucine-rich repeat-containing N-terminal plant-type domain-containing protein n=1 Tax=Microthlaspi erraticum TaxID=1685480 RepID=A0A6D2L355_9BRAS|nr:unnamed protein product [Microthlaspi erraticum]